MLRRLHYQISKTLDISESDAAHNPELVRTALRKAMQACHPDKVGLDNPETVERFKMLCRLKEEIDKNQHWISDDRLDDMAVRLINDELISRGLQNASDKYEPAEGLNSDAPVLQMSAPHATPTAKRGLTSQPTGMSQAQIIKREREALEREQAAFELSREFTIRSAQDELAERERDMEHFTAHGSHVPRENTAAIQSRQLVLPSSVSDRAVTAMHWASVSSGFGAGSGSHGALSNFYAIGEENQSWDDQFALVGKEAEESLPYFGQDPKSIAQAEQSAREGHVSDIFPRDEQGYFALRDRQLANETWDAIHRPPVAGFLQ